tara:strand:- start:4571 stop:5734 length:1164 start_codon:yes stop_codon:yes gene_type:complete
MKLALVIEKYDPSGGGAERSTRQIAQELASRGNQVTVLCAQCPIDVDGAIQIALMPKSGKLTAGRLTRFSNWVQTQLMDGGFDASISMTTAVPGTILQPRSGTAIETMQRNLAIYPTSSRKIKQVFNLLSPKKRTLLKLERQTLANPMVRHIAANSSYVARQLSEHYAFDADRVTVIPNAATLPDFTVDERQTWRTQVREGYRIAEDQTVFVFAAMNPMLKGLTPLMIAFARLVAAEMPVVLMLAGKYKKQYVDQADSLGIRDKVRFVGPTNEMVKLYAAGDVLVHPTFYDPSSKVVIEALMMGIPAISTSYNGASDMIVSEDGSSRGRVIQNPSDTNALAEAMIQLVDAETRKACSEASVGLAESLSMKVHVDRLIKLVENVLAEI